MSCSNQREEPSTLLKFAEPRFSKTFHSLVSGTRAPRVEGLNRDHNRESRADIRDRHPERRSQSNTPKMSIFARERFFVLGRDVLRQLRHSLFLRRSCDRRRVEWSEVKWSEVECWWAGLTQGMEECCNESKFESTYK